MNCPIDNLRKLLSLTLSLTIVSVSVAVPIMDRGEVSAELAVESEHDPSRCQHAHDHTVCAQVGANVSVAHVSYRHRADLGVAHAPSPAEPEPAEHETFLDGPPSRAPPLT